MQEQIEYNYLTFIEKCISNIIIQLTRLSNITIQMSFTRRCRSATLAHNVDPTILL